MKMPPLKVMICAGEVSGDMYGASLMAQLRTCYPTREIEFRGMGGDAMQAAGCTLSYHTDALGAMGFIEVLAKFHFFKRVHTDMVKLAETWHPDVLITIDYYSFNIALAERVHAMGIKTVQYVSPKVWVWRRKRIYRIAAAYDLLLCIFPFEPALYEPTGLKAIYVGHPLIEEAAKTCYAPVPSLPWYGRDHIALLPGSRRGEIRAILPTFLAAAQRIERVKDYDCSFIIPVPTPAMRKEVERVLAHTEHLPVHVAIVDGQARAVMRQARAAMVASGTATLEACLMDCPAVLAYRVSWLTEVLARIVTRGARLKFAGLVNIIAERLVMPELLQRNFTVYETASHVLSFLRKTPDRYAILDAYREVQAKLAPSSASGSAVVQSAQAIVTLLTP